MDEYPRWDNKETGELVAQVFGGHQWRKAHPCVRSLNDRTEFARYHYHEAVDMMNEYIKEKLPHGMFGVYKNYDEFSYLMLKIRANLVALVQSLHAIPDTCAHMLFYCLAFDKRPDAPKERGVTAKSVCTLLDRERDEARPEYAGLCKLFASLTSGDGFKRLDAFSNTFKHRSIVRPSLNEDLTGKRADRFILELEEFWYDGHSYKKIDARQFAQAEHDRMQPLTVDIGVELNAVLRARMAQ